MMGRLNHDQEQFFYSFRLDEAVPNDHPVREVAAVLDLSWVHSELAPYYPRLGRPSIPIVVRKLSENWQIVPRLCVKWITPRPGKTRLSLLDPDFR